jgi:hypothetical protein
MEISSIGGNLQKRRNDKPLLHRQAYHTFIKNAIIVDMLEKSPKERADDFIKEYGELVQKHQFDIAHYPVFVPNGQGQFSVTIQSTPVDLTKIQQNAKENTEPDKIV